MKVSTYAFNSIRRAGKRMILFLLVCSLLLLTFNYNSLANEPKLNMSYMYFGDTQAYIKQVKDTNGAVSTVAPSYFDIKADGSLDLKVDTVFVKEMKKIGVRVVPFLSNHWDRALGRKGLANRQQLAKQIADAVVKYDLDGVNVDIENVTDADRDNYTQLVKLLREYLPANKEVSVAVAANPYGWKTGWHGSYDYKELAKYSDYLMIMSYDESYQGSTPGPVASLGFVEKSIKYALNQQVPSDKIVLGIPFFARYWVNDVGGNGISSSVVDLLINRYNAKVGYDQDSQSPYAVFTLGANDPVTRLNGSNLKPGYYTIWYENSQSIQKKIELVHKYNLKGTGSWSLNQAPAGIWDQYMVWLNGATYKDIVNHWAEQEILVVIQNKWMIGSANSQFLPNRPLTRAEAAVVLVRAMGISPAASNAANSQQPFTDIKEHWAKNEIVLAYQYGLLSGMSDTKFAPDSRLSREQLASLLSRVVGNGDSSANKGVVSVTAVNYGPIFKDLDFGRWSYAAIAAMTEQQLLKGYTDGNFYPANDVTRAEFAVMLQRLAAAKAFPTHN